MAWKDYWQLIKLRLYSVDVTELHDEEDLLVQMQDRWENYGSLDGIADP